VRPPADSPTPSAKPEEIARYAATIAALQSTIAGLVAQKKRW
jgi:hypothetical protein